MAFFVALVAGQRVAWVGRKKLDLQVVVVDTDKMEPIPDARVTIFQGGMSPIEGHISWRKKSDFEPDDQSQDVKTFVTNSEGRCSFSYSFPAAGSSGFFRETGYVDTSKTWLRVEAMDRPIALVLLDRQSVRPRDIHDLTPVVVTVVANTR